MIHQYKSNGSKLLTKWVGGLFFICLGALGACGQEPDFGKYEAGEELPGGLATTKKASKSANAFSQSSANMNFKKELDFKIGNALFRKLWVSSPASTKSSDGLGPLFNARSCQRCHLKDGRGHTPTANFPKDDQVSLFLRLSVPPQNETDKQLLSDGRVNVIGDPTYGTQLQDLAIQGHSGEGHMDISYTEKEIVFPDQSKVSLRVPTYTISALGYGPLAKDVMISPRVTPQMIGLGLVEAISAKDIEALEDPNDRDGNGISGRANKVWSAIQNKVTLGRFGLKAGAPSIKEQSAGAFAGDLGLSTSLARNPSGDCTKAQVFCVNAPNGNDPKTKVEVSDEMLDLVTFYAQNLAVPARRAPKNPIVLKGKGLFHKIGCASCHQPSFKTGKAPNNPHLSNQTIWPYSDFLLHDMGKELADNRPEAKANGSEWRTSPLWGIGLTKQVSKHTFFLHDGRARSLQEAILWHGGEAEKSKNAFMSLAKADREALLAFLKSL